MSAYLGRDRKHVIATMTAVHTTVSGLITRTGNLGHKLYVDNFFPDSFNQSHGCGIWTHHALFLLQWVQHMHMSQLPFKHKKFRYMSASISHCVRVSNLEIYHLTA
jgi:hypothetical protein